MTERGLRTRRAGATIGRAASWVLRHHIENGVAVAACLAAVAIGFGLVLGPAPALLAGTGALCVSVVDQPGRPGGKPILFLVAVLASSLVALLAGLAQETPWALAAVIAAMSAGLALATVYGRRALALGISAVLSLVLGIAAPAADKLAILQHSLLFALGGTTYALLAMALAWLLVDRTDRMFLSEALRGFAGLLRARAAALQAGASPESLRPVMVAHGVLMERLQAARDAIFPVPSRHGSSGRRLPNPSTQRRIGTLLALLDAYEACLASDADWDILAPLAGSATLARFAALTQALAHDADALALALVSPAYHLPRCTHVAALRRLDRALALLEQNAPLRPTRDKIAETGNRMVVLADWIGGLATPPAPPGLELSAFVQIPVTGLARLAAHLTLQSPIMRYAIRLTMAMLAGYALTLALPAYVHGGWILLTVALIMRASYALTRQRRNDRILGTLAGCAVAALLIPVLPPSGLFVVLVLGAGVAHAYATVAYRVASFAASVMALLLLHLLEPREMLVITRIVDTLLGAGLAAGFSYLLPSWEWRDMPGLETRLYAAMRAFAAQALRPQPAEQEYRLARKQALDSFTALATTARRLSDEPGVPTGEVARLGRLQAAAYLFASDLASVRAVLRLRGAEIPPDRAARALEQAHGEVMAALAGDAAPGAPPVALAAGDAVAVLESRLRHVALAAARLPALATSKGQGPASR